MKTKLNQNQKDRIQDRDTLRNLTKSTYAANAGYQDVAIMYENILGSILQHLPEDVRLRLLDQFEKSIATNNQKVVDTVVAQKSSSNVIDQTTGFTLYPVGTIIKQLQSNS